MSLLPHIWTYVFKLHLIDLLSVCYTANFATNTVKNQHRLSHYTGWRGDFFLTPQLCIQNGSREQNHAHHPSAWTSYNQHVHQIWSLCVYSLRRYERRQKMQKLRSFGGLRVTQGHRNITIWQSASNHPLFAFFVALHTHRQTGGHMKTAYTTLSIALHGKNERPNGDVSMYAWSIILAWFLLRDTMLSAVYAIVVCLSVCRSHFSIVSKR